MTEKPILVPQLANSLFEIERERARRLFWRNTVKITKTAFLMEQETFEALHVYRWKA